MAATPKELQDLLDACAAAVLDFDVPAALALARRALALPDGELPRVVEDGFARGLREVGGRWERGEAFLPELAMAAQVTAAALGVVRPALARRRAGAAPRPGVVIGTVRGDIHDIGKSLVAALLAANGFPIEDLGADVPEERFVEAAVASDARFVCASALLTTTMPMQRRIVEALESAGVRGRVKVVVGGAPTDADWAARIGADGHAPDAVAAVRVLEALS